MSTVLDMVDVRFGYDPEQPLLRIDALSLEAGESALLSGPSGSGKSTLLGLVGGVLQPDHGQLRVCGQSLAQMPSWHRDRFRAEQLGLIFQLFNLLPYLNARDNVLLPLRFAPARRARAGANPAQRRQRAEALLAALDLPSSVWTRPAGQLSIGQQQRVAAARALLGQPALILADEPTSALDADNRDRFLALLLRQARSEGSAVLVVSHDPSMSGQLDRHIAMNSLRADAPAVTA